jgi:hypothetical protein
MISDARNIVRGVWEAATNTPIASDRFVLTGSQEHLPSIYRVNAAATCAVALVGLAYDALHRTLGKGGVRTSVDGRDAALAFRSESFLRINGNAPAMWAPLSGDYRSCDGYVRLHANYPHHARAIAIALGTSEERAEIEAAVLRRSAIDVETAVLDAGGAAAALRARETWRSSEAGRSVLALPLVEITQIGDAPAQPPHEAPRILDLTRVISGPLCGKVLASAGAEVLRINSPRLPDLEALQIEMGFGKRAALLELDVEDRREAFATLVRGADAIVQSHRPGALSKLGFGPEEAIALRPGLVYVSISAYGRTGPFAERRGFDSLVQLATGLADEARRAYGSEKPVPLPAQALDHATGWLAAFGTLVALERRAREGGSWRVDLSLARTAEWLASLGPSNARNIAMPIFEDAGDLIEVMQTPFGVVTHLRSPLVIDGRRMDAKTTPPIPGVPLWS